MTANEIRGSYLEFFGSKGHVIVPSTSMVIKDDPMLMFTNAGMNQWRDIILGTKDPEPRRRADSRRCLRISSKHNDLEEVGRSAALSHHTMFEVLGDWSFGNYFKKGAIDYAYEYLVDILHLDPKDLYVTVFEDDKAGRISRDDGAASCWKKHFPKDRIANGNKHDNFQEMGDADPCGPCSEIHTDFRPEEEKAKMPGEELVSKDHPQVIEIWSIVFMQFNRKADGSFDPLKMHVIDTGIGFERLVRLAQDKSSNYDTDIFAPVIAEIGKISGKKYNHTFPEGDNSEGINEEQEVDIAMRVTADHLRTVAFSTVGGQLPNNAKAGYIIRRILRRAVRYAYTFLGQKEIFIYKLLNMLAREMGIAYPELTAQRELIGRVMREEEDSFLRTLEKDTMLLDDVIDELKVHGQTQLDGKKAFHLFDTYGFPLNLTELICAENRYIVGEKQFNEEMEQQKARMRNAVAVESGDWEILRESEQEFVDYDYTKYGCHILHYREVTQKKNSLYKLILDYTPFYGEMGGQVDDQGVLVSESETISIIGTKRGNSQNVHIIKELPKNLEADFIARMDTEKRDASTANHAATHLLDYALEQVLSEHAEQKGSYVSPDTLHFDVSHFQKITDEELRQVGKFVNEMVRKDYPMDEHRDVPMEEAKKVGAVTLFGGKCDGKVCVIRFGPSYEFCGGIHATSTGCISSFKIVNESNIAAGVRCIEAMAGETCKNAIYTLKDALRDLKSMFNNAKDLKAVLTKFVEENDSIEKELKSFRIQAVSRTAKNMVERAETANGVYVVETVLPIGPTSAKDIVFKVRETLPEKLVCILGSIYENHPLLSIMLSDDMVKSYDPNAGRIIHEAARLIRGGDSDQPHCAQAGDKNADDTRSAVDRVIELISL